MFVCSRLRVFRVRVCCPPVGSSYDKFFLTRCFFMFFVTSRVRRHQVLFVWFGGRVSIIVPHIFPWHRCRDCGNCISTMGGVHVFVVNATFVRHAVSAFDAVPNWNLHGWVVSARPGHSPATPRMSHRDVQPHFRLSTAFIEGGGPTPTNSAGVRAAIVSVPRRFLHGFLQFPVGSRFFWPPLGSRISGSPLFPRVLWGEI